MKIFMCDDCKYFPPLKKQQQYAIFYKLDLNKEMYIELQFANKKNCKYITTHFLFNPFLHICCTDSDASEVANLQAGLRLCFSLRFWGSSNAYLLIESFFRFVLFLFLLFLIDSTYKKRIHYWCCFVFSFLSSPFLFKSAQCVNASQWVSFQVLGELFFCSFCC